MKHTHRPAFQIAASLLLPAILSSTLHAGETVRWADLPKKVGQGKLLSGGREGPEYTIVTINGETFRGRTPIFGPTGVNFNALGPTVPRQLVAEVRVRHRTPWSDAFSLPSDKLWNALGLGGFVVPTPLVFVLVPALTAINLAAFPVVAAVEGGRRLATAKTFEVKP